MTPEAQRIAIAEACGLDASICLTHLIRPPCCNRRQLPDYLNDLNACHEMEKVLTNGDAIRFRLLLSANSGKRNTEFISVEAAMCHATAPQRCEAFLRTKGLWRNDLPILRPETKRGREQQKNSRPRE